MKINNKHTRIFGTIFLASLLVMLVGNIDNTSAIYNWVEYEGFVTDDNGNGISNARVYLKDTDTGATVDYDNTNGTGYYYIKEYVDATERFDLKAIVINTSGSGQNTSWTDYTYEDVLGRAEAEPWWYDFDLSYVSKYAIIVGLNTYSVSGTWGSLDYCENDADDWNSHLTNSSGVSFDNVKLYEDSTGDHDGRATETNIKSALASANSSANEGDIISFIFSGHGDDGTGSEYSLCMWDADNGQSGEDGFLNHTELADIFDNCRADRVFFFFDSCYSEGMKTSLSSSDISNKVFLAAAAGSDEIAYEDDANDNGCWTYCFLEYAWFYYYDYGISTSFDDIFSEAHDQYQYKAMIESPTPDFYNDDTQPEKHNGYGYSFDLDNYS